MTEKGVDSHNRLRELLSSFSLDQLRYVSVRPTVQYDKDAAAEIGLAASTVYGWPNKADVDDAIKLMVMDGVIVAGEIIRRHLPEAARVIAGQLKHRSVNVSYRAAKDFLDRGVGAASQRIEHTGKGGEPLTFRVIRDEGDGTRD